MARRNATPRRVAVADEVALDTAWRIHSAVADWTGKVDAKAAFCFAIESAALVAIVNLTAKGRLFDVLDTSEEERFFRIGLALLVGAIICSVYVVIPRLRGISTRKEWQGNFIYFGHLRRWEPGPLETQIQNSEMLPVLTTQLVNMSKIAWRKHVMVQASLVLALLGGASLGWCAYRVLAGAS